MSQTTEEWRAIPDWNGYDVSDRGRVRSYRAMHYPSGGCGVRWRVADEPQRILKPNAQGRYLTVMLSRDGKQRRFSIHTLVLIAFVGPRPDGAECCHYDGNPTNNRLDNLRWDTVSANHRDAIRHGWSPGLATRQWAPEQAVEIREERAAGKTYDELIEKWGGSHGPLGKLVQGLTYKECAGPLTRERVRR